MKNNNNQQGFLNHCNTIRGIEHDKDEFLKAAKLARYERKPRLESDDLTMLITLAIFVLPFVGLFALMILKG